MLGFDWLREHLDSLFTESHHTEEIKDLLARVVAGDLAAIDELLRIATADARPLIPFKEAFSPSGERNYDTHFNAEARAKWATLYQLIQDAEGGEVISGIDYAGQSGFEADEDYLATMATLGLFEDDEEEEDGEEVAVVVVIPGVVEGTEGAAPLTEAVTEHVEGEPVVGQVAEHVAAEPVVEQVTEHVAAEPVVEQVAEHVAAEPVVEQVAEHVAAEPVVEQVAEHVAAEPVVEQVAEHVAAEPVVEQVAEHAEPVSIPEPVPETPQTPDPPAETPQE